MSDREKSYRSADRAQGLPGRAVAPAADVGLSIYNWTDSIASTLGYRVLYTYDKQNSGGNRNFRYQQWMYSP